MNEPKKQLFPILHYLNIPIVFTLLGLYLSIAATYWLAHQQYTEAVILIIGAILCDQRDGMLARKLNRVSDFGAYLDVMGDFLTYCLFPVVAMFALLSGSASILMMSGIFLLAGSMRLAHYLTTHKKDMVIDIPGILLIILLPYINTIPGNILLPALLVFIVSSSILFVSALQLKRQSIPGRVMMFALWITGAMQLGNLILRF